MAGKMTILDRLMKSGKLKPGVARDLRVRGEFFDPLQYTTQQRILMEGAPERAYMAVPDNGVGREIKITPERQVYQRGLDEVRERTMAPVYNEVKQSRGRLADLQSDFEDAYDEARNDMLEDWQYGIEDSAPDLEYGFDVYDLDVGSPNTDMRDYWPSDAESPEWFSEESEALRDRLCELDDQIEYSRSPEYRMRIQTQSPRYRNYQRAMQQRAANKRMGHQLSRMWGDAYNRLRARGLSDAEARMFIRERFGGR